jgi:hypothetical protein
MKRNNKAANEAISSPTDALFHFDGQVYYITKEKAAEAK